VRLALAQINTSVGDFSGNRKKITDAIDRAAAAGADLVCLPELATTGYPPEDLLMKTSFLAANQECLQDVADHTRDLELTAVVGYVDVSNGEIYNSAAVLHDGAVCALYHKIFLPNYGVFDEKRYFGSGDSGLVVTCAGVNVGLTICEDVWHPAGPLVLETRRGAAQVILNLSSSPYYRGKECLRERMLSVRAADNTCYMAYVNLVGAQDELVFDGNSMVFDEQGELIGKAAAFQEDLLITDIYTEGILRTRLHDIRHRELQLLPQSVGNVRQVFVSAAGEQPKPPLPDAPVKPHIKPEEEENNLDADVYHALVLGVHDYVNKNGFQCVLIGLSGGIDSAITAAVAVDALSPGQVTGVFMPSAITSDESRRDAETLAANLGIRLYDVPIKQIFDSYLATLDPVFEGQTADITTQNIQARIRGNILMAMANQYGAVVLTTGNKSEMSVGYATLYGDMAGGFAVLKDIPKTLVYRISRYKNHQAGREIIPANVLVKAPTAELRPDQKDEDDLPPYSVLDKIIEGYVELDYSAGEIIARHKLNPALVHRVIAMIDHNEYKRRQAPPGVKITPRAFGKDRRVPITNHFHDHQ
jgi:NAD+ synthase (glutamine-hydrolysing)